MFFNNKLMITNPKNKEYVFNRKVKLTKILYTIRMPSSPLYFNLKKFKTKMVKDFI